MPNVGDLKTKFGRKYMFLNPDPFVGPGTWRLSQPEEFPGTGGGGTGSIEGVSPIEAITNAGTGVTEVSLDILPLESREQP